MNKDNEGKRREGGAEILRPKTVPASPNRTREVRVWQVEGIAY